MKILVACEESGRVTQELNKLGHWAWSCDIKPTRGDPKRHITGDVREVLSFHWDMMIAFPPCTYLTRANSGNWKKEREAQISAIKFVKELYYSNIPRVAIENPIGILSTVWMPPTQIIQPYQFGHKTSKSTCLWLKNLPLLKPTSKVHASEGWEGNNFSKKNRSLHRSATYMGIAKAMATQWTENIIPIQLNLL